jgi:hypothetical protein
MNALIESEFSNLEQMCGSLRNRNLSTWFKIDGSALFSKSKSLQSEFKLSKKEQEDLSNTTKTLINYFELLRLFCEGHYQPV